MPRPLEQADEYILAAFMAGDLPHSLRQEIIAYIASSDEALDLLAMAQVAMDAAASGDGASKALAVPSILTPRRNRKGQLANALRSRFNERHLWKVTALFAGSVLILAIIVALLVVDQSRVSEASKGVQEWAPRITNADLALSWTTIQGASHYHALMMDQTTGSAKIVMKTSSTNFQITPDIIGEMTDEAGHEFRLWILAFDAQGHLLKQSAEISFIQPLAE